MTAFIQHIDTAVPETRYDQDYVREVMKAGLSGREMLQRRLHKIYAHSGIEMRHSVIRDFKSEDADDGFYDFATKTFKMPSTGRRNRLYQESAKALYARLGKRLVEGCPGIDASGITHIVTVSCTGFFAPGPDYFLIEALDIPPTVERYHLGFMGCYAALPALKMAHAFCERDARAVVLVICLELCTLHLRLTENMDDLVAAAVFADGAAGAIVSARTPRNPRQALAIEQFASTITETGAADMAWGIGDTGFEMVLSRYVPGILEANINAALQPLFAAMKMTKDDIAHWALHPGGRAILDKLQQSLELSDTDLAPARKVLCNYGNMSSATMLFVLKEILALESRQFNEPVCAAAFGPGLTVESGLFLKNPVLQ
jgi:predicted naringenin-chalcone synthase